MEKHIEDLAKKAAEAVEGHEALHLSQAALNLANAMRVLADMPTK